MSLIFSLSLKDKLNLFFKKATTLGGLVFFLFGMIFVVVFGPAADFSSIRFKLSATSTTTGTIIESRGTNYSESDRNIIKYNYKYEIQGIKHYGKSFSSTTWVPEASEVEVEYLTYRPQISRIKGMKRKPFSMWIVFVVAIFPLIGLSFLIHNFIQTMHQLAVLNHCATTFGRLVNSVQTNTQINNRYLYKLTFEYTIHGQLYTTTTRTVRPEILEDELEEPIIYSINYPGKAILFDTLPISIQEKLTQKFPSLKNR